MRVVELDASDWEDELDFYDALKLALGSCEGHGSSPDAWIDSMVWGGMNAVEAPYIVQISGFSKCIGGVKTEIELLAKVIADARAWRLENRGDDIDVSFRFLP